MRKTIFILSIITAIIFTGCSRSEIEKNPVVLEDTASLNDEGASETSQDLSATEEGTKITEVTTVYEEVDSSKAEVKTKPITIEIEGTEETIRGLLHAGDGYDIMYDVDRFEYSDKDGVDTFVAENSDPAIYPYVYISISHLENSNVSDYVEKLSDTLAANSMESEITTDTSIGNYKGMIITANAGTEWNSIIRNYYIIENGTSIYTIETQYFLDAEEGYGARFQAMLNTFEMK
jgi:hypothetical protein